MNKNVLIAVVVIILLLLLGGAYFAFGRRPPSSTTPAGQTQVPGSTSAPSAKKSLKDLISLGQSQQCSFQDAPGNSGTMYVSGGKSRGDFTSGIDGTAVKSHMVYDGQAVYIWMDGQSQGYKSALDTVAPTGAPTTQKTMDVNQALDYNCTSWSGDSSLFTLPSGVEFLDASAMMPKLPTAPGDTSDQCAACEQLTGSSRTQCRTALNCQ